MTDPPNGTFSRVAFVLLALPLFHTGCSGDDSGKSEVNDESDGGTGGANGSGGNGSGASASGGSGASGGSDGDGGSSLGGEGGMGGARDDGSMIGPPEIDCMGTTALSPGNNYGDYSLFAIRVAEDLGVGAYSIRVQNGTEGTAYLFADDTMVEEFDYDPEASLENNTLQTIIFADYFELDLRSQTHSDLSALDESLFDGCHTIAVADSSEIGEGETYGSILVEALTLDPNAEAGVYTFITANGNAGMVELRRDGEMVDTLSYAWMTTIGGGDSFTFEFPGVLNLTVTREMGTSNLFALAASLFDGRHEVTIP